MLEINLATRVYVDNRKVSIVIWSLGTLCALFLLANIWLSYVQFMDLKQTKSDIDAGLANLNRGRKQISDKDFQLMQEQIKFANGVLMRKSHNWLQMLDRFEQVVPDGVMISAIEPDKATNTLRISGLARDFGKVRAMYEVMGGGPLFKDVFLTSQTRLKVTEQQQGVSFSMTAKVAP